MNYAKNHIINLIKNKSHKKVAQVNSILLPLSWVFGCTWLATCALMVEEEYFTSTGWLDGIGYFIAIHTALAGNLLSLILHILCAYHFGMKNKLRILLSIQIVIAIPSVMWILMHIDKLIEI